MFSAKQELQRIQVTQMFVILAKFSKQIAFNISIMFHLQLHTCQLAGEVFFFN